jgi:hypothetical protein
MGLLKTQERLTKRAIPFAMLFTQTSPALRPKTQRFIEKRLAEATKLYAEKLIAAKLREADEGRFAPPERRPRWPRRVG